MEEESKKFYTDLALELCEQAGEISGITSKQETAYGVNYNFVSVDTSTAADVVGKPIGEYYTLDIPKDDRGNTARALTEILVSICKLREQDSVLVVGLGNKSVTADSLGPLAIEKIEVTRHIEGSVREISAIAPSVLGKTGIETAEIIKALVSEVKPKFVIAIDSLASLALERVNTTIQVANTGINPGAGIGNFRKKITEENVGCPVIAIGVPTVATLATVTNSALDIIINKLKNEDEFRDLKNLEGEGKHELLTLILENSHLENIVVTPKNIDEDVAEAARFISSAINEFLL